ncbi:MAG: hypothetical protein ABJA62_04230 [Luteimonas sp.]
MITQTNQPQEAAPVVQNVQPINQARRNHRERDFGVGYGNSSGYASGKRYTNDWAQPRFKCA